MKWRNVQRKACESLDAGVAILADQACMRIFELGAHAVADHAARETGSVMSDMQICVVRVAPDGSAWAVFVEHTAEMGPL